MWPWRINLPGLGAALAEAEPMDDVVQPAFEQAHQRVAGVALARSAWWKYLRNCRSSTP